MKKGIILSVFAFCLLWAAGAGAYTITMDADPSDWIMVPPANLNTGHIARGDMLDGEYVWLDMQNDERPAFLFPDTDVDIVEFRITSDAANLYFMFMMTDITQMIGDGAVQVQVAIDSDYVPGSGQTWLGQWCDTQVSPLAAWEYLVVTRFGSGNPPLVYNTAFVDVSGGLAQAVISDVNETIEIAVPWGVIGNVPAASLHFTVVSLRADVLDIAWEVVGPAVSDVLDAVTNYLDPGSLFNTDSEVADQVVDYHFEVWFHLDMDIEPSPPLVVSEIMYDPTTAEPAGEWIEVFNRTGIDGLGIVRFKVGDEETTDGGEGMEAFPVGGIIASDDVVVVANDATAFNVNYGFPPDFELAGAMPAVPDMVSYGLWATGNIVLSNTGDHVLILDPFDTIIDAVAYGNRTYPGVVSGPDVSAGHTLERPQPREDSDDCTEDFVDQDIPTPGAVFRLKSLGGPCTRDIECDSGFCVGGVCCNTSCDGTCDDFCDASGMCQPVVCPVPTNVCEIDTCDVVTGCFAPAGTECTDTITGDCNDAQCDGTGTCDQAYAFEDAAYVCRGVAGVCDIEETCTGSGPDCPSDGFEPSTTVCRVSAGDCDIAESCTGTSASCPVDALEPSTTMCRASAGDCDAAEYCTGTGADCPADVFDPPTTVCRVSAGVCDAAETCTGTGADCPADSLEPSTTVCRDAAYPCDAIETCTGTSMDCPADEALPDGSSCSDGDLCTESDTCTSGVCAGVDVDCSALDDQCNDGVCNSSTGECEALPVTNGTLCDDGDDCTEGEACLDGECTGGTDICVEGDVTEEEPEPAEDAVTDAEADAEEDAAGDAVEDLPPDAEDDVGDRGEKGGCSCKIEGRETGLPSPMALLMFLGTLVGVLLRRRNETM